MGKRIVSWSPIHGQSATTLNTIALASLMSIDESRRSLLTHAQLSYATMETMYSKEKKDASDYGGVVALRNLVKSNLLKSDAIADYTETIYKSTLDFLPAGKLEEASETNQQILLKILAAAEKEYDFTWIDAHSGLKSETTRKHLKQADLILVHLPQDKNIITRFFEDENFPRELVNKPYIVIIGKYDPKASYSLKNIKRHHKIKGPILAIPYTTDYKNAVNQDVISEFFIRIRKTNKGDQLFSFIYSLREINKQIINQLELSGIEENSI